MTEVIESRLSPGESNAPDDRGKQVCVMLGSLVPGKSGSRLDSIELFLDIIRRLIT